MSINVLLVPVFVILAQECKFFLLTWFLTFLPLARLIWGFDIAWIDNAYPIALMSGAGYIMLKNQTGFGCISVLKAHLRSVNHR
jgi:hypothetical protein